MKIFLIQFSPQQYCANIWYARKLWIYFLGLINEQNRKAIPYFIKEFTLITYQTVFSFIEVYIPLALRASQYCQQFFADAHIIPPSQT